MMNILAKVKINNFTYLFFLLACLCGFMKNIAIIFIIVIWHELGHIIMAKREGMEIVEVEILPFGGYTTINKRINNNIIKDLLIASGGIIAQLLLYLILLIFKDHINIITYHLFMTYNTTIILFNLIPIIPLDGSKICHLILEFFFSYHLAYYLNFFIAFIFLILFSIYNYVYHLDNYLIISFLILKIVNYVKDYKYLEKRFLLERYLYELPYHSINSQTKNLKDLKIGVLHFFKENNCYIRENTKIDREFIHKMR